MKNTRQLLAAVKARHQLTSDYQLAKFLNVSKQRISANMAGTVMNDEAAIAVADALGIERGRVLAIVSAERATSERVKREWEKLAATAAAILAALAVVQIAPAQLEIFSLAALLAAPADLYIHYTNVTALVSAAMTIMLLSLAARTQERAQGKNRD